MPLRNNSHFRYYIEGHSESVQSNNMKIYLKFYHASLHEVNHQEAHNNLFQSMFCITKHTAKYKFYFCSNHKVMLNKWFSHIKSSARFLLESSKVEWYFTMVTIKMNRSIVQIDGYAHHHS